MSEPHEILTCPHCGALIVRNLSRCRQCGKVLGAGSFNQFLERWFPSKAHILSSLGLLLIFNFLPFAASLFAVGGIGFEIFPNYTMIQQGALSTALVILGEPWRIVTANFVHFNILHLLMNGLALVQLTPLIENLYDRPKAFLIFFLSGTLTTFGFFILGAWLFPEFFFHSVAGGASAGVFGFLGAGIAGARKYDSRGRHIVQSLRSMAIQNVIFGLIILPLGSNVLHLFGFLFGFLIGQVFPAGPSLTSRKRGLFHLSFAAATLLVAASFAAQIYKNRGYPLAVPAADLEDSYKSCFQDLAEPPDFYFEKKREEACQYTLRDLPHLAPQIYFTLLSAAEALGDPLRISKYELVNEKLANALPRFYKKRPATPSEDQK